VWSHPYDALPSPVCEDVGLTIGRFNNAATQNQIDNIEDLPSEQWRHVSSFTLVMCQALLTRVNPGLRREHVRPLNSAPAPGLIAAAIRSST
jgi:hypothetical protein